MERMASKHPWGRVCVGEGRHLELVVGKAPRGGSGPGPPWPATDRSHRPSVGSRFSGPAHGVAVAAAHVEIPAVAGELEQLEGPAGGDPVTRAPSPPRARHAPSRRTPRAAERSGDPLPPASAESPPGRRLPSRMPKDGKPGPDARPWAPGDPPRRPRCAMTEHTRRILSHYESDNPACGGTSPACSSTAVWRGPGSSSSSPWTRLRARPRPLLRRQPRRLRPRLSLRAGHRVRLQRLRRPPGRAGRRRRRASPAQIPTILKLNNHDTLHDERDPISHQTGAWRTPYVWAAPPSATRSTRAPPTPAPCTSSCAS
jgi:hypothetical protein